MWQKQLHDESENQSDTAMDESASTSTIDDLLHKKPTPIRTETLVIDDEDSNEEAKQDDDIVLSPMQVETIDLELEEESIPKQEEGSVADTTTSDDGNNINANKDNANTTTSSNSSSSPNNSRKNKKKKKSRSRSKF